ncbi:hypothetical protein ASPBRDRAFT_554851 [Aspergillus brasiliensis CBS 101740]|uniref:Uncharacterized protein n=1 Tax=Aspergillus brasiliensis (strain CBS 101740 / IMI 381727 / IBT 21946) TaxID=767769 RepID=A0A1L9UM38_ASPBC|nr:hypothetical protein ASPBRDRAFT_554851 [Aspergillus brasiliensis CBS 101740]
MTSDGKICVVAGGSWCKSERWVCFPGRLFVEDSRAGKSKKGEGQRKQLETSKQIPAAREVEIPREKIRSDHDEREAELRNEVGQRGERLGGGDQSDKPWSGLSELKVGGGEGRRREREGGEEKRRPPLFSGQSNSRYVPEVIASYIRLCSFSGERQVYRN